MVDRRERRTPLPIAPITRREAAAIESAGGTTAPAIGRNGQRCIHFLITCAVTTIRRYSAGAARLTCWPGSGSARYTGAAPFRYRARHPEALRRQRNPPAEFAGQHVRPPPGQAGSHPTTATRSTRRHPPARHCPGERVHVHPQERQRKSSASRGGQQLRQRPLRAGNATARWRRSAPRHAGRSSRDRPNAKPALATADASGPHRGRSAPALAAAELSCPALRQVRRAEPRMVSGPSRR